MLDVLRNVLVLAGCDMGQLEGGVSLRPGPESQESHWQGL